MRSSIIIITTILLIFMPSKMYSKDWKKALKSKSQEVLTKVENKIKKEVKPLTIDFQVSKVGYNPFKSLKK